MFSRVMNDSICKFKTSSVATGLPVALTVSLSIILSGCGESASSHQGEQFAGAQSSQGNNSNGSFNQTLLLTSVTDNVITPTFEKFLTSTQSQKTAIDNYCNALVANNDNSNQLKTTSQDSWKATMAVWQMAEVMQIGPLLDNNGNLRDQIYSWPNVSSCSVDQDVVRAESNDYNISERTNSRRGLDALEYLLFNDNLNHSCTVSSTSPIGWNERSESDKANARCHYTQLVADDLVQSAQTLLTAWTGTDGQSGYAKQLKQAGLSNSQFQYTFEALNKITDALFYITETTKDAKIATPLGLIANDCGLAPCTANQESQYADNSLENILNNMKAIQLVFLGGELDNALGFDDFLNDVDAADTSLKMRNDLNETIQFIENIEQTLSELLTQNPDTVEDVHDQVKAVTDNLKTDFIQRLSLELPATSAGDND